MKTRTMTAFGAPSFHKNYVADKYTYPVLAIDRLSKEIKEMIRAKVKTLASGREAQMIIGEGWTCEVLDQRGHILILKYNGIEVALFLQRQVVNEQPQPGDPIPEVIVKDELDKWQRLDIIGPSAKQANFFIKREVEQLKERNGLLEAQVQNLQELADSFEIEAERKQQEIERLKLKLTPAKKTKGGKKK